MSIWASIVTFDDFNEDATGVPPIIYTSSAHPPDVHSARGGQFDVARCVGEPVDGDLPGLRFAVTTASGQHAVVVLDGFQVIQMITRCRDWIDQTEMSLQPPAGGDEQS